MITKINYQNTTNNDMLITKIKYRNKINNTVMITKIRYRNTKNNDTLITKIRYCNKLNKKFNVNYVIPKLLKMLYYDIINLRNVKNYNNKQFRNNELYIFFYI